MLRIENTLYTIIKAEAPCSGATGIRRAGEIFSLLDGVAYDPSP
jgi:hypothetical protein